MGYDYKILMQEIAANLGKDKLNNVEQSLMKRDIYNVTLLITRKTESTKLTYEKTITPDKLELLMPEDFYVANDIVFYGTDNLQYDAVEIDYEEFNRWQPNVELITSSFVIYR